MSEEELDIQESERKYRSLFESSRDAIMILEPPSWNFTSGNPSTVKLFKAKDEAEFITHGPGGVSPAMQPDGRDSGEKAKEMIGTAMRDGSNFFEWTHKRIDGAEFAAEVLLTRMELGGKTILQATVRDITERKKAEDALHSANAGLEARMSQLNEISKALISDIGIQRATGIIYENGWRLGQRKARPLHESWKGDKKIVHRGLFETPCDNDFAAHRTDGVRRGFGSRQSQALPRGQRDMDEGLGRRRDCVRVWLHRRRFLRCLRQTHRREETGLFCQG